MNSRNETTKFEPLTTSSLMTELESASLLEESETYHTSISGSSGQEILLNLLSNSLDTSIIDNEWSKDYLNRLASLSLESLKHEPTLIKEEETKIQSELAELSFREYKSFIQASECKSNIQNSLENCKTHLSKLSNAIPIFEENCESFIIETEKIMRQRTKINTIIEQHGNLLDILEIPQLMDICVRKELYSEAIDLSAHVTRLIARYPKVQIIQRIENDVKDTMQLMLSRLIALLSEPIKLPSCLKVIGYLRRMEVFDEAELRLVFLLSRDSYLQLMIKGIDNEKRYPIHYLKKYIDIFREHFFDIVTQYRSIFSDDGISSALGYSTPSTPTSPSSPRIPLLLSDYTAHILGHLTGTLAEFIPLISDTSSLSSILTQLMYCGMSLGRVGVDFRHLVTEYFEIAVLRIIRTMISETTNDFIEQFEDAMRKEHYSSSWMIDEKKTSLSSYMDSVPSLRTVASFTTSSVPSSASSFTPLVILMDYPPIGHLTNGYLSAFNSLRLLAPVSLYHPLGSHLSNSLASIADVLRRYGDKLIEGQHNTVIMQVFSATFAKIFVPYITRCYVDGVYGGLMMKVSGNDDETLIEESNGVNAFSIVNQAYILDALKDFLSIEHQKR
ncbi:4548_t:CDS:2 [Ambispora leptoticha]|uniref:Conserved oligomeric Golgi complex subunit 8 n=1 Tax=Ambispora leptoticha TaxID=144679 RepID=A0A9N9G9C9_9GLOM|nr:4548_t:CDS:2 [Ambispora leptoticha]